MNFEILEIDKVPKLDCIIEYSRNFIIFSKRISFELPFVCTNNKCYYFKDQCRLQMITTY